MRYVNTHNEPMSGESFEEYNNRLDDMRREISAHVCNTIKGNHSR
jgi:hypothetical protein